MRRRASGLLHCLAQRRGFAAYAFGCADDGRLGLPLPPGSSSAVFGACGGVLSPQRVTLGLPHDVPVSSCAAGGAFSLFLLADGRVFAAGCNAHGQLGRPPGAPASARLPLRVPGLPPGVVAVSAGGRHAAALCADGRLFTWGADGAGQAGQRRGAGASATPAAVLPAAVDLGGAACAGVSLGLAHSLAWGACGELWAWGDRALCAAAGPPAGAAAAGAAVATPLRVRRLREAAVASASAGWGGACAAVDAAGGLHVWGRRGCGAVDAARAAAAAAGAALPASAAGGGGDGLDGAPFTVPASVFGGSRVSSVACGGGHALALTAAGSVWAWGADQNGCLGLGDSPAPAAAAGARRGPAPVAPPNSLARGAAPAVAVAAGWRHSAALYAVPGGDGDGEGGGGGAAPLRLATWGWGGSEGGGAASPAGQLGTGGDGDEWAPCAVDPQPPAAAGGAAAAAGGGGGGGGGWLGGLKGVSLGWNHTLVWD